VYVFLLGDALASVSFRGRLVSGADSKASKGWSAVPELSTFGDSSYILLVGPPPYPSWQGKEVHGSMTLDLTANCSEDFRNRFKQSVETARVFLQLLIEVSGLGGI